MYKDKVSFEAFLVSYGRLDAVEPSTVIEMRTLVFTMEEEDRAADDNGSCVATVGGTTFNDTSSVLTILLCCSSSIRSSFSLLISFSHLSLFV